MTQHEINQAICEHLGYLKCICPPNCHDECCPVCIGEMDKPENWPDFCDDLNAMHIAEHKLEPTQRAQYENWLAALRTTMYTSSCTAAQRAEAFLRTLGKWKD